MSQTVRPRWIELCSIVDQRGAPVVGACISLTIDGRSLEEVVVSDASGHFQNERTPRGVTNLIATVTHEQCATKHFALSLPGEGITEVRWVLNR